MEYIIGKFLTLMPNNFTIFDINTIMRFGIIVILLLAINIALAQADNKKGKANMLSKQEASKIFTEDVKGKLKITFPVVRTYSYNDTSGKYYMVLSEKYDGLEGGDTLHKAIKAFNFKHPSNGPEKQWEINDAIENRTADYDVENSIWFWTKFCVFQDIDKDGIADPILVYGTSGINGTDDGRVKIVLYYKGKKILIRHKNGTLDEQRNTKVDAAFYSLPKPIQNQVTHLMRQIMESGAAIFPDGWENNMKKHKLEFSENE
jgi:hypothetical protein